MPQPSRPLVDAMRSLVSWPLLSTLLGLLVVLGLLLEVSARLVLFGLRGLDPRRVGIVRDLDPRELVTYQTEASILYEYKPDLDVFFKLVPFRTNSRGMRDDEYSLIKPTDGYRVAVVGSSFTLPAGVEIEHAFHSVLERKLSAEFAPKSYEFLNFAVGLHSPSQILAMIRHRVLAFDPDLILVGVTSMAAPRLLADWDARPPSNVLDLVAPQIRSYFLRLLEARLDLAPVGFSTAPPQFPSDIARGANVLEKLADIRRETGIPIVLVRLEVDSRPPSALERTVQRLAEQAGLFYVDTRQAFDGTTPSDFSIYELDPHPNRVAHAMFASTVDGFLRSRDLLGR